ncbi:ABC transporter ATP-binding protein [Emticicia sp. BO119]|uniref:ABC transporter ATP-binding protein n=1 Tax=Emticicia sp. BO119 TaxID=2757768 RepID=UPI0015F0DDC6|nr:ABC transporter ATP-binding protein [Emticicia sp. BO119]MBA4849889.1 ABC transporter ATP-binding protein [Emticicia sp. BO119]
MLQAKNIRKSYGNLQVLRGIDLTINQGEIVSIVGASGAGKTTLLHILGTLDKADSGEVLLGSVNYSSLKDKELARFRNEKISFIFQFHNLMPEFTALENVCIPAWIQQSRTNGKDKEAVEKRATELLTLLGLGERTKHFPSELSGGEQQRVAVARALINSPAVVFADEPSGNLDSKNAEELHHLFFELRKKLNQTFVIITHNEHLADMSDRKLVMQDGQIL